MPSASRWPGSRSAVATLAAVALAASGAALADQHVPRGERVRGKREFDRNLLGGATRTLRQLRATGVAPDSLVGAAAMTVAIGHFPPATEAILEWTEAAATALIGL